MSTSDPALVFITSRGHSGSTLLEMLIGAHSQVFAMGEVKQLPQPREDLCRCQRPIFAGCPFWQRVDQVLQDRHQIPLQELEPDHPDPAEFVRHNRALFQAVAEVSGARVLVDSSKNLKRLETLVGSKAFDVRIIHLFRRPQGVVYSNARRGRDWKSHSRNYTVAMMKTRAFLEDQAPYEIRYEDLASDPERVLRGVMSWLGLSFEPSQMEWASKEAHNLAGNPTRFSTDSTIREDHSWKKGLSWSEKLGVAWLTLPTRMRSRWLYEAHRPYWKGEGFAAWRAYRRARRKRWLKRNVMALPRRLRDPERHRPERS